MEYIIEFILEMCLEVGVEASKSNKVPKFVRYLLIAVIALFFIGVIGLIFYTGILILDFTILGGILMILLGLFMLISGIVKFRKTYLMKKYQE